MFQVIAVAMLTLYAAIAWVILKDYRHTRNIGFLIIGCGVVVWPLVSSFFVPIVTESIYLSSNLWGLLDRTAKVIQAGLILIGLVAIERSINSSRIVGDQR